mgnify:CR=1 FL=1|tara:strand:+ start:12726 stop:14018 length:1293 start_codon:yes stop_codon:yes gene_type:complete
MKTSFLKISINPIIFSLLFLPLKIQLGSIFNSSENLLQQSSINIAGNLEKAQGLGISFVLSDIAALIILIFLFRNNSLLKKNHFIYLSIIYSGIFLGALYTNLDFYQTITTYIYNSRFLIYSLFFLFKTESLKNLLPLFRKRSINILPIITIILSIINPYLPSYFPNFIGSRLEILPPLFIFGIISFLYHKINNINLSRIHIFYLILLSINYLSSGKRGLIIPIIIGVIFYFIIKLISRLKLKRFSLNYKFTILAISLPIVLALTLAKTYKGYPSVDTNYDNYYSYVEDLNLDNIFLYLDGSTQERIGKIVKTFILINENKFIFFIPQGINSFKLIYGFLPDSILESLFSIGIIQSFLLVIIITNLESVNIWLKLNKKIINKIYCFIPIILILGYGLTFNILNIVYIYPPLAFFNCVINSKIKKLLYDRA